MDFKVNEFTTIKDFDFTSDKAIEKIKFGTIYNYREFKGEIDGKKVTGLVCLEDDNVFDLKYA
jgi:hypothetical protein